LSYLPHTWRDGRTAISVSINAAIWPGPDIAEATTPITGAALVPVSSERPTRRNR
jgi:hypothetical protein